MRGAGHQGREWITATVKMSTVVRIIEIIESIEIIDGRDLRYVRWPQVTYSALFILTCFPTDSKRGY
jgi:hypothetical protein